MKVQVLMYFYDALSTAVWKHWITQAHAT